jgi:molybdopterin-containing oxidoreductase family membrane subunit
MVPAYKMKKFDAMHIHDLFAGNHALLFWSVQIFGLILPIILLVFKQMRKPLPMLVISVAVLIGAWFKRYIIVVPTMEHPFLPIQNVPLNFKVYLMAKTRLCLHWAYFLFKHVFVFVFFLLLFIF